MGQLALRSGSFTSKHIFYILPSWSNEWVICSWDKQPRSPLYLFTTSCMIAWLNYKHIDQIFICEKIWNDFERINVQSSYMVYFKIIWSLLFWIALKFSLTITFTNGLRQWKGTISALKWRVTYPSSVLIVSDGLWMIFYMRHFFETFIPGKCLYSFY